MGFTQENRRLGNQELIKVRRANSVPSQIKQCLANQAVLRTIIDAPDTKPLEVASCVRAWNETAERLRILRGKPLPGHLQPGEAKPKRKFRGRSITSVTPELLAKSMETAA